MMIHGATKTWSWQASIPNVLVTLLIALLLMAPGVRAEQGGPFASLQVDTSLAPYSPQAQVSGGLEIQGSDTMAPLMTRLAAEFQRRQPQVKINVKGGGSTKAVSEFLAPPPYLAGLSSRKREQTIFRL